jgi:NAD-dependent SIR2 family protein deacetylase
MNNDELNDFFLEGGDELLNTEVCPHCGNVIYLDQEIEWIDKDKRIAKCPGCGEQVKING